MVGVFFADLTSSDERVDFSVDHIIGHFHFIRSKIAATEIRAPAEM